MLGAKINFSSVSILKRVVKLEFSKSVVPTLRGANLWKLDSENLLLFNADPANGRFINSDSQTRTMEPGCPAAASEGEVLINQRFLNEKSIKAPFMMPNSSDRRGELPACCGENSCLTHLATQLIAESMLARKSR